MDEARGVLCRGIFKIEVQLVVSSRDDACDAYRSYLGWNFCRGENISEAAAANSGRDGESRIAAASKGTFSGARLQDIEGHEGICVGHGETDEAMRALAVVELWRPAPVTSDVRPLIGLG